MSTKSKIISGFAALILIIMALAATGYSGLQTASSGFNDYRRLSRFSELSGDIAALMPALDAQIYLYNASDDQAAAEKAHDILRTMDAMLKETEGYPKKDTWSKALRLAALEKDNLDNDLQIQEQNLVKVRNQYVDVLRPSAQGMGLDYVQMQRMAVALNNSAATIKIAEGMNALAEVMAQINRLAFSRSLESARDADAGLERVKTSLDELEPLIISQEGKNNFALLRKSYLTLKSSLTEMNGICATLRNSLLHVSGRSASLRAALDELNHETSDGMGRAAASVHDLSLMAQDLNKMMEELQ